LGYRGQALEAPPGTSTTTSAPGIKTYVDALAALVPAEVLTAHAAILTFTSDTMDQAGEKVVKITEPVTLVYASPAASCLPCGTAGTWCPG